MEALKKVVRIDLREYGMEGEIELRKPGPRKINQLLNDVGSFVQMGPDGTPQLKDNIPFGDLQVAMILRYTAKAPYGNNANSFWEFMDVVEAFDVDKANALYKRLVEAAKEVSEDSPFAGSPPQETENSA